MVLLFQEDVVFESISVASSVDMKLFSLTLLISVVCCFLCSCEKIDYKVVVETGIFDIIENVENPEGALMCTEGVGTEGKVYITLYGERGNSPKIRLENKKKPAFQNCTEDIFDIKIADIGLLYKIRVELDAKGLSKGTDWYLMQIAAIDETRQLEDSFFWNNWLNTTAKKKTIAVDIEEDRLNIKTVYKVIVETGNDKDAGTNGSVYITLYGSVSEWRTDLDYLGKLQFQRGQTNTFYLQADWDIGIASKIGIELDSTGLSTNDNWFLKKVSLQDLLRKFEKWYPWNQWLTPTADQKIVEVEIPPLLP